jgi:hypothetical protein
LGAKATHYRAKLSIIEQTRAVFVGDSVWDAKSGFAHAPVSE